jgi:tetratricopeptide (TPR) repeat protein
MKLRSLAMTFAALVLFAVNSLAQVSTLQGTVTGLDGKPVVGALVKIHRTDIKWDQTVKTDKRGHYIHTGVPLGGTFDITIEIDGKAADKIMGVHSSLGDHPDSNFDLRKSTANPNTQAMVQKAVETGQISDELKRQLTPEQKALLEKQMSEQGAKIKKQGALNASFNEGVTDLGNKQYEAAITALDKANELDDKQPAVWANLGDAYTGLAGTKTGPDFDAAMQKALDAYTHALTLNPNDASAHNNYALALAKTKKYPEMEAELRKAAELDPATAFSKFYNLGALMRNNGQDEAAGKAFKMAIDAAPDNPRNAESYYWYGMSLASQATLKDDKYVFPPGTIEAFQKYLELAPTGPNAQTAKDTIAQLGGTIQTSFQNPNAPANKKKK